MATTLLVKKYESLFNTMKQPAGQRLYNVTKLEHFHFVTHS